MPKETLKIIPGTLLFIAIVFGLWQGGSWVWNWFATHENVCTKYSVIESMSQFQDEERRSQDVQVYDSFNEEWDTETEYYYVTVTKWRVTFDDATAQILSSLPDNYTVGNEVCTKYEWRER